MTAILPLPDPQLDLDYPLMEAILNRRSVRKWSDQPLNDQEIANILWCAAGQTKPAKGKAKSKRTVPSACNSQEIRIYALTSDGTFLYDEIRHGLVPINDQDIRSYIGSQKMMHSAPLGLVYVADLGRMASPVLKSDEAKDFSAWVDTGFVSQNVYLYCAATDLATVVLALVKRDVLSKKIGLSSHEKIVLTQVIGHSL